MTEARRPDPDVLLARVEAEAAKARRGRLKVFFGAAPGVGKTYAMLLSAQRLRAQRVDVVVGVVETHGRSETAQLLDGLEKLERLKVEYRGRMLEEFDLDAALRRAPSVLLLDELAHTNARGSRHPKRWQDVEELLDAGIEVHSTLNVQHLESLNDVIGNITGVRVAETVPDRILQDANEIVLVDLSADDLLQRLKEGKVYVPDQASTAIANFFRRGNLLALRELALRRTAERVDIEMRSYRQAHSGSVVWAAKEAVLACVGPVAGAEKIVRSAARLASALDANWHAIYVETPRLARLSEHRRNAILRTLALAERLGATTATIAAVDAARAAVNHARTHNLNKLVVGRHQRAAHAWLMPGPGFARAIAAQAPDLDIVSVAVEPTPASALKSVEAPTRRASWQRYGLALAICAGVTTVAGLAFHTLDSANIAMFFILGVLAAALRLGRGPAALAAVVSVLCFDVFFVQPYLSLAVSDLQYLVTFVVMLVLGLVVAELVSRLQYQARIANYREERASNLFSFARDLSGALSAAQIAEGSRAVVGSSFRGQVLLLVLRDDGEMTPDQDDGDYDNAIAKLVLDRGEPAGLGTDTLPAARQLYLPLRAPMRTRGVLVITPENARLLHIPEQRRLLETYAALIAIALERVHYVSVAQSTLVDVEAERLRNSLLSALSHDMRTPLTVLISAIEMLEARASADAPALAADLRTLHLQSAEMIRLVDNILEMARLQGGAVRVRNDWQSLEELVGGALAQTESALSGHPLRLELPAGLPLVYCDARMIERVLINLLENAAKYSGNATPIGVTIKPENGRITVSVWDEGPGLPPGQEEAIFEKFRRGSAESSITGVGLGLAIARTIVLAHGGTIRARSRDPLGAEFSFSLPIGK